MEDREKALGTARLLATATYAAPLVAFPMIGRLATGMAPIAPETLGILARVLALVGVVDYAISLLQERKLLAQARLRRGSVVTAAAIVSALGASLAVYGLVLTLLGAPLWGAAFYVFCAIHGLHLMVRWPDYQAAIEGSD